MLAAARRAAGPGTPRHAYTALEALSRAFTSLPVIDVAPLCDPSSSAASKQGVARQLHAACRDVGFFYVVGHGVPQDVTAGVLAQARRWFALPEATKRRIALGPATAYRGWQALGANVTRYDGGFSRDWHEAIDLYKEVDPASAAGLRPSPVHGTNPWPAQLPAFEAVLRQYVDGCLRVGGAVMRGIARGLGLPEDFFGGAVAGDPYWVVRVIHYPPLEEAPPQPSSSGSDGAGSGAAAGAAAGAAGARPAAAAGLRRGEMLGRETRLSCGEHTDYGLLTLVNQEEGIAALQVRNAEGQWVTAEPLSGSFVCNIGDMMKVLTNGLYTPTLHRVINASASGRSRVSIPFFYETNFEAVVAPLPQFCQRGRPPLYEPVEYGRHLESKVLSNFEL